ncbi:MAG: hypothetical protein HS108_02555 [Planctomycetes bacterium]|jgi:hypothetical protein|nr:hypothetical protein [Planctomycetota bacterium]MCL4729201.1 hypothetical protein [Planctomycetota bacterium]
MRHWLPLCVLILALAGCGRDAAPAANSTKPDATPAPEAPKAGPKPGVTVETPATAPKGETVTYTVEGMH